MTTALPISGFPAANSAADGDVGVFTQGSTGPGTGTTRKVSVAQMLAGGNVTATTSLTPRTLPDRFHDWINVKDYGAVLNGTTDDTTAINAARGAVLTNGTVKVPAGGWFNNTTPAGGPSTPILWQMTGNSFTTGTTPVTGIGTDVVETFFGGNKYFGRSSAVANGPSVLRVDQTLNYSGGTSGFVVATTQTNTTVSGANANSYWGILSVVHTTSTGGGRGVATVGFAHKDTGGTDQVFGANFYGRDNTGLASSVSGALVGTEIDVDAKGGLDDGGAASGLIPSGQGVRVGLDLLARTVSGAASAAEIGYVLRVSSAPAGIQPSGPWSSSSVYAKRLISAVGAFSIAAVDTSFATAMGSANAFRMAADQTFAFDGLTNTRTLSYVTADTALEYSVAGTPRFRINDGGGIQSTLATGNQGSALALIYPGGTTAAFTPKVAVSGALSGQIVGGPAAVGVTSWTINSDSLDTTTGAGAPKGINDFYIGHNITAGATGGRNGVNVFLNQTGATTLAAGQFYVGVASNVVASFNAGGVSGTPAGAVMGFNPRAVLQSGATFFNSAVGMEADFGARAGSSVAYKYGVTAVLDQLDAVDGSVESAAFMLALNASAGPTSTGLLRGISFGSGQGWWPINPTLGTLIGVAAPINGSGPAYTALYGVDVSAVSFVSGGASFKATGFLVDPNGRVTTTGRVKALRNVTASGAVTISSTSDEVVVINKTAGAATAVSLPASPSTGRIYTIKDGKGDAAANNITISPAAGNIDGAATLVIATNYGSASLIYNGTQWNVV